MSQYTILDIDECKIITLEGKTFTIDVWYIDIIATWLPTNVLVYDNKTKTLTNESNGITVKVVR